jgi:hypothetical protein
MGQRASLVVAPVGGTLLWSGTMGVMMRSPVALQCYRRGCAIMAGGASASEAMRCFSFSLDCAAIIDFCSVELKIEPKNNTKFVSFLICDEPISY